jgi:hypothetical protein
MTDKVLVLASLVMVTALSLFQFPGRTILQSDTQIYLPILEHYWDPSVLTKDLVATDPHVAFTIYDETLLTLRKLTGAGFETLLFAQQIVYRWVGIVGLFLIGRAFGFSRRMAFLFTALLSLGATITGPAVLTVEYEPVPRGFALPFLLLTIGLLSYRAGVTAAIAAGVAFLFHPPTALAACVVFGLWSLWKRQWIPAGTLVFSAIVMLYLAYLQRDVREHQSFFGIIPPWLESLQRMRATYNWVSLWFGNYWIHYTVVLAAWILAYWRLNDRIPRDTRPLLLGLPIIGVLSIPFSWLFLEKMKWILIPQWQPGRYLLFLTLFALMLAAIAGLKAAEARRYWEAFAFLLLVFLIPLAPIVTAATLRKAGIAIALSALALAAVRLETRAWGMAPVVAAAVIPFFAIPILGPVQNYAKLHRPELDALANWARYATPVDSVFQFADFGQGLEPGVFRARGVRALYADWKSGGQVNFLPEMGAAWWQRWQRVRDPQPISVYRELGIDFVVFHKNHPQPDLKPVYENDEYLVYQVKRL